MHSGDVRFDMENASQCLKSLSNIIARKGYMKADAAKDGGMVLSSQPFVHVSCHRITFLNGFEQEIDEKWNMYQVSKQYAEQLT